MKSLLFFLACFSFLSAFLSANHPHYHETPEVSSTEGLPSSLVNGSVCAISGEYVDSVVDLVIPGPEPLIIARHYGSHSGWSYNHVDKIRIFSAYYNENDYLSTIMDIRHASGSRHNYLYPRTRDVENHKKLKFKFLMPKGFTNAALSGKSNMKNQKMYLDFDNRTIEAKSPAGDQSFFTRVSREDDYHFYVQQKMETVSGNRYVYKKSKTEWQSLPCITCENSKTEKLYSKVTVEDGEDYSFNLITSNDRTLNYHHRKHIINRKTYEPIIEQMVDDPQTFYYLDRVKNPSSPKEYYKYGKRDLNDGLQIKCRVRSNGNQENFLKTRYYHYGDNHVGGKIGDVKLKYTDDYRIDRVKCQSAPVGTSSEPIITHRFEYDCNVKNNDWGKEILEGHTDVYDVYDHLARYAYDENHRLSSITRYQGTSDYSPYSEESFLWGQQDTPQEGNLMGRFFKDQHNKIHHARYFNYDDSGNLLSTLLFGHLTGLPVPDFQYDDNRAPIYNGCEVELKTYTYSAHLNNLLSETDSNGKVIEYEYHTGTDRLKSKMTKYGGRIQLREFYFYKDENHVLTQKITDDGSGLLIDDLTHVTQRLITDIDPRKIYPLGLPKEIKESCVDWATGKVKLLQRQNFEYSPEGRLCKKEVYDANNKLAYALTWEYDLHGNVIEETNAIGETTIKKYDEQNNLIFQQSPSLDSTIENTYDFVNRLIRQDEKHSDGQQFTTTYSYNYLGQCKEITNPYGQVTIQKFDEFGRVTKIKSTVVNENDESVPSIIRKVYDSAGNLRTFIDPKGRATKTKYNIRGQPTKIEYPDETTEYFFYRLDGQLTTKIDKNGLKTTYTRDYLGRIEEEILEPTDALPPKKTKHIYNALHLLQTKDPEGLITTYEYDAAGRLEWTRQGNHQVQNLYDPLGRIGEIREWFGEKPHEYRSTQKEYDLLDRLTEERLQDSTGRLIRFSRYEYDSRGNRTLIQNGDQVTLTKYNAHNNPTEIINALGQTTHIDYNTHYINSHGQRVLQTITTDPLGYQTVDTYDTVNRLVQTERRNPFGIPVSHQAIYYDLCGKQTRVVDTKMQEGKDPQTIETLFSYREDDQISSIKEAIGTPEQKTTYYHYNTVGQKKAMIKPDGIQLTYEYDGFGRLKRLKPYDEITRLDGSFLYEYAYNLHDQVTRVKDLKSGQETLLTYNTQGELESETLGNGLKLGYTYDRDSRIRQVILPDKTGIECIYDAAYLKEVHRLVKGKKTYVHADLIHNLTGQVTHAKPPGKGDQVHYTYDLLGRCTTVTSTPFYQHIPPEGFDPVGNLKLCYIQDKPYAFTYDDLYQIKTEEGHAAHTYAFDSLFNRTAKDGENHDYNHLHQLLQKGQEEFSYDRNGNLKKRHCEGKTITYDYDELDRLIAVTQDGIKTTYTYDSFNRRLAKNQGQKKQLFVYQGQEEIGLWENGAFQELRLLSKNTRSPAVAIELKGQLYVPQHDLFGNVVCLSDAQGQVIESYRYTAFGESEILSSEGELRETSQVGNPWQYAGKRLDPESGLVAFGLRYYDPELGRWITPDPAGFEDGPNLYAYVHNSPLQYYDQFGLFSVFDFDRFDMFSGTDSNFCQPILEDTLSERNSPKITYDDAFEIAVPPKDRHSEIYDLRRPELPGDLFLGFMNGVNNTFAQAEKSALHLSNLCGGYNVHAVYNATHGFSIDIVESQAGLQNVATKPVRLLHEMWNNYFDKCSPNGKILMYCHSQGVIHVRNALLDYPEELRQRIFVVAIAPGGYIYPGTCGKEVHYRVEASRDLIPYLDIQGSIRASDTTITLKSDPSTKWHDHNFTSKTYEERIMRHFEIYQKTGKLL